MWYYVSGLGPPNPQGSRKEDPSPLGVFPINPTTRKGLDDRGRKQRGTQHEFGDDGVGHPMTRDGVPIANGCLETIYRLPGGFLR